MVFVSYHQPAGATGARIDVYEAALVDIGANRYLEQGRGSSSVEAGRGERCFSTHPSISYIVIGENLSGGSRRQRQGKMHIEGNHKCTWCIAALWTTLLS